MRAKITKRTVDASQSRTRDAFIWDTETKGFGLKVTPAGNRVYVVQARLNGRPVRCTIGKHGAPWTPDMAREEAVRKLGQIAAGINPNEARAEARRDLSLAELCDLYFSEGCNRKKRTTLTTERGQIARHIKPLLGKRRLKDLSRGDIERFIATGISQHLAETGDRCERRPQLMRDYTYKLGLQAIDLLLASDVA